jgi:hypothetical protein
LPISDGFNRESKIENPKWPDGPIAKSLNPLKPVPASGVEQMEQSHRQVARIGTMIGQEAVIAVRVIEAAIASLVGEDSVIAGSDQLRTNAQPESRRFLESRSHRRRVVIHFGSSTAGVMAILGARPGGLHASLQEAGESGKQGFCPTAGL